MTRVLELQFQNEGNKSVLVHITNPKTGVTSAQAKIVGELIVAKGSIYSKSGKLVKYNKAQYRSSEVVVVD